jgi:hypothetical protein
MKKICVVCLFPLAIAGCMSSATQEALFPGPTVDEYNGSTVSIVADGIQMNHPVTFDIQELADITCGYGDKNAEYISYQQKPTRYRGTYLFVCK